MNFNKLALFLVFLAALFFLNACSNSSQQIPVNPGQTKIAFEWADKIYAMNIDFQTIIPFRFDNFT